MLNYQKPFLLILTLFVSLQFKSQNPDTTSVNNSGWFSLGGRSTASAFGDEGNGIGTGGQFRVQLSNAVNTEWFADYITINVNNKVRSEYIHIGWSVMYYPFSKLKYPKLMQPYVVAGHCFDYNKMTVMADPFNSKFRWGSAVQCGLATHINLTPKFDITLMSQYMIHFTETLEAETDIYPVGIKQEKAAALQGHLLTTISFNYKIFKVWKGKK